MADCGLCGTPVGRGKKGFTLACSRCVEEFYVRGGDWRAILKQALDDKAMNPNRGTLEMGKAGRGSIFQILKLFILKH
jgi:hypothetical protein